MDSDNIQRLAEDFSWDTIYSLWPSLVSVALSSGFTKHPLGFLHAPVAETDDAALRLHVWKPGMRSMQEPAWLIHTHTFELESVVVLGCLVNNVYEWIESSSNADRRLYEISYAGNVSRLEATCRSGTVRLQSSTEVRQKQKYQVNRGKFHHTHVSTENLTVTVALTRRASGIPLVVGEISGQHSHTYARSRIDADTQKEIAAELEGLFVNRNHNHIR